MNKYGFVQEIKREWKTLWNEKFDDKLQAESIALKTYPLLFVDAGTVLSTAKGCSIDGVEKIVRRHEIELGETFIAPPNLGEGGYRKFIRTSIISQPRYGRKITDSNRTKSGRSSP